MGDLASQIRGVTFAKGDASDCPADGLVPVLRAGNISDDGLSFDDLIYVPELRISAQQFLQPGDVVIAASSGSLGVVGKAARVESPVCASFGAFCKVLRPSDRVDASYFAHYFRTHGYRRRMSAAAEGLNIHNLRSADLDELEIRLPPLDEQRRIAQVLDTAAAALALRRLSLDTLTELRQSVLARLLDAHHGSHGSAASFGDLLSGPLGNGISPASAGTHEGAVLTLSALRGGVFDGRAQKPCVFAKPPAARQLVKRGTFLVSRGNGNVHLVGAGAVVPDDLPNVAYPDTMIGVSIDHEQVTPEYLEAVWASTVIRDQLERAATTTNGTFKINQTKLAMVEVPLPPLESQVGFSTVALRIAAQWNHAMDHLDGLVALFSSLQQRAFSGAL